MKQTIFKSIFFCAGLALILLFSAFLISKNSKDPKINGPKITFTEEKHDFGEVKVADFHGRTLILPDVQVLNDEERKEISGFAATGRLVVTGHDATQLPDSPHVVRFSDCPGKAYSAALQHDFAAVSPEMQSKFLQSLNSSDAVEVTASSWLATDIARVDGNLHVFFANFKGLRGGVNPIQTPETGAIITVKGKGDGYFLPFLGRAQKLRGESDGARTIFKLPPIQKGGVFWIANSQQNRAN